ncbi:MAG TPA: ribokinase [Ktedonobacterales bacterium]|nr:ribokinase [Ktedonobacterales bacterium]
MGDVIVFGSLMTDLVVRALRLPAPGESLLGESLETFLGGKGCNQAIAAARMGTRVALIGCVGEDTYGDAFLEALDREGVDRAQVTRAAGVGTGTSCVLIASSVGQNAIIALPRANLTRGPAEVMRALDAILARRGKADGSDIFLAQCETDIAAVAAALAAARHAGLRTILNAAPIPREPLTEALPAADLLVVNETEAAALAGMPVEALEAARDAAEHLLARGPREIIVTLGERGAVWSERGADGQSIVHHDVPAFPVRQVDATAAGDAFCGALAAGLARGDEMMEALRRASAAGALAATRPGALPSLPAAHEVAALLAGREGAGDGKSAS